MTAVAFVLVAAGIALWPGNLGRGDLRPVRADQGLGAARSAGARSASRLGPMVAGLSGAALCVVLLGPSTGLVVAAVVAPLAALAVLRVAARSARNQPAPGLALALDLTAAGLRAGRPLATALELAVPVVASPVGQQFRRVSGLLRLGADPEEAWRVVDPTGPLGPVAIAARRSAQSGTRLADAFDRLAADTRADLRTAAESRASRAGVFAMAPLGLCFLPAFVCLGIVPVVVGIAHGISMNLP